jgi:hypothetical protein
MTRDVIARWQGAFRHVSSVSPPRDQLRHRSSYCTAVLHNDRVPIKVPPAPGRPQAMTVLLQATQ